jgi:xanthine/uracil/vitamin C permease (AzgA family)
MQNPTVSASIILADRRSNISQQLWIGVFCGGLLTAYLMSYKVKSAIVIGIGVVTIMSWPYVPILFPGIGLV